MAEVGWLVGWLNILGQVAGMSSTEYGLSEMIWAAVVVAKDGNYKITSGKIVGLFVVLLLIHGILVRSLQPIQVITQPQTCLIAHYLYLRRAELPCNAPSRDFNERIRIRQPRHIRPCVIAAPSDLLAHIDNYFYKVIIIVLLATTGRSNMHSASYVFGSEGVINQTNGWNSGLAFLFGLLSVQWTVREDFLS